MNSGITKTAVFLSGLPGEAAQSLLERLEPETAKKVRVEMTRISGLPKEKVRATVAEFLDAIESEPKSVERSGMRYSSEPASFVVDSEPVVSEKPRNRFAQENPASDPDSERKTNFPRPGTVAFSYREFDREYGFEREMSDSGTFRPVPQTMDSFVRGVDSLTTEKASFSKRKASEFLPESGVESGAESDAESDVNRSERNLRFPFLHTLEPGRLIELLDGESPLMVAVVLAHIPSRLAGNVLSRFSETRQNDVVARLMQLEETDEEILEDLEEAIREKHEILFGKVRKKVGPTAVREILKSVDPKLGRRIMSDVFSETDSKNRTNPMFEDLETLDDRELLALFESVDTKTALLSLVGASRKLIDRIVGKYTPEQERELQRQLDRLGPIDRNDVQAARQLLLKRLHQ